MRKLLAAAMLVGGATLGAGHVAAHHSFGATYLESDTIEVTGTIVEFQYKNPHAWVFVSGTENTGFGGAKTYGAEWVSTSQLEREGIEKDTLRPGDSVKISGSPAKNPADLKIHLKRIERNDGWAWRGRQGQAR